MLANTVAVAGLDVVASAPPLRCTIPCAGKRKAAAVGGNFENVTANPSGRTLAGSPKSAAARVTVGDLHVAVPGRKQEATASRRER